VIVASSPMPQTGRELVHSLQHYPVA
jgi:hypothetical protein